MSSRRIAGRYVHRVFPKSLSLTVASIMIFIQLIFSPKTLVHVVIIAIVDFSLSRLCFKVTVRKRHPLFYLYGILDF